LLGKELPGKLCTGALGEQAIESGKGAIDLSLELGEGLAGSSFMLGDELGEGLADSSFVLGEGLAGNSFMLGDELGEGLVGSSFVLGGELGEFF